MDTTKFKELTNVFQDMQDNKIDTLKEFKEDLINPNIPVAEKVHEVLTYMNELYIANENLYKFAKLLYEDSQIKN